MPRAVALATSVAAQEAAQESLADGATALGAALTGFFVCAGRAPGVLFAPMSLVVGGLGSGVFCYDGRHRQPGKDAKRPRGFQEGEAVPLTARASVPCGVFAAALACAFHPGTTILSCARPGVSAAKQAGAKGRAGLLEIVATMGATALSDQRVKKAIVSQFGSVEEGLLTPGDLLAPPDIRVRAQELEAGWGAPWRDQPRDARALSSQVIVAGDAQGLFAALSFDELSDGPHLDPFEVTMPLSASPVLRGVTRVAPGTPLPHGNTLHIERDESGGIHGASASAADRRLGIFRASEGKELLIRQG